MRSKLKRKFSVKFQKFQNQVHLGWRKTRPIPKLFIIITIIILVAPHSMLDLSSWTRTSNLCPLGIGSWEFTDCQGSPIIFKNHGKSRQKSQFLNYVYKSIIKIKQMWLINVFMKNVCFLNSDIKTWDWNNNMRLIIQDLSMKALSVAISIYGKSLFSKTDKGSKRGKNSLRSWNPSLLSHLLLMITISVRLAMEKKWLLVLKLV